MVNLTFGEQVKLILGRKGMTIKQLAELVEERTGKPMSRQNMTQRLGRDNFQEQDMRLIADILGCKFQLSIMETAEDASPAAEVVCKAEELHPLEREITIGELADMADEVAGLEAAEGLEAAAETVTENEGVEATVVENQGVETSVIETKHEDKAEQKKSQESDERNILRKGIKGYFKKSTTEKAAETQIVGDVNPYTGKEYKTNSVRMHPKRIGYVQVYDQEQHKWTDMTEWAFLGYQERKKVLLGKDYEPPIYLD
ncbi:MAG: hypothetical protein IJ439_01605 [Tyzzerella sp.]|nr:hypothetical protein [Tyzzerella sp.]